MALITHKLHRIIHSGRPLQHSPLGPTNLLNKLRLPHAPHASPSKPFRATLQTQEPPKAQNVFQYTKTAQRAHSQRNRLRPGLAKQWFQGLYEKAFRELIKINAPTPTPYRPRSNKIRRKHPPQANDAASTQRKPNQTPETQPKQDAPRRETNNGRTTLDSPTPRDYPTPQLIFPTKPAKNQRPKVRVATLNIRGARGKSDLLMKMWEEAKIDVLALTETWQLPNERLVLPLQYEAITLPSTGNRPRGNGGVAVCVSPNTCMKVLDKGAYAYVQHVTVSVYGHIITAIYISPGTPFHI